MPSGGKMSRGMRLIATDEPRTMATARTTMESGLRRAKVRRFMEKCRVIGDSWKTDLR
jgi:hypothetical protein